MPDPKREDLSQDFAASRPEFIFGDDDDDDDNETAPIEECPVNDDDHDPSGGYELYALLGLAQDTKVSNADIRDAFRRLAETFHPDKYHPSRRRAAERHFKRIQYAYDTLTDPQKRVVYDLLGAEGLKREYSVGGSMRSAKGKEVGQKNLTPHEFRRWFIGEMKKRERRELESLIESRTSVTLGVNAIPFVATRSGERDYAFRFPKIRPSSLFLRSSFRVPLPFLRESGEECSQEDDLDDDKEPKKVEAEEAESDQPSESIAGHLRIHGGLGGRLQRPLKDFTTVNAESGESEQKKVLMPVEMFSRSLSLGTTAFLSIPHEDHRKRSRGIKSPHSLASFWGGSEVELGAQLLPAPSTRISVSRAFTPVKDTLPIYIRGQTLFNYLPWEVPPAISLTASRQIGLRRTLFCAWSSGSWFWSDYVTTFLAPLQNLRDPGKPVEYGAFESSNFSCGMTGFAAPPDEATAGGSVQDSKILSKDSWAFELGSNPMGSSLSFTYGRYIFRGRGPGTLLSKWSAQDYHSEKVDIPGTDNVNAVRLEIQTSLNTHGTFTWLVRGNRKIGDFTRAGLSVGLQGPRGIVIGLTWNRLGQNISIPVAVCPVPLIDADIAAALVAIPWLAYSIVHYGLIEPRFRKRRKQALEIRKQRLAREVEDRKVQSLETVALMKASVERRQDREASNGGLVIIEAKYGPLLRSKRNRHFLERNGHIDVTIPLAAQVQRGQLTIGKALDRSQLIGFYDPAPMKPKLLCVRYLFNKKEHYCEFLDSEDVICPGREHQVKK